MARCDAVHARAQASAAGALAVFITSAVSMASLPVGLDLDDFFPIGTPEGEFTKQRLKFFPVWPLTMNWGQLDYTDPNVQMGMVQQWENVVATNPLKRAGDPEKDIGPVVVFLASEMSAFVNGEMINVDGGQNLPGYVSIPHNLEELGLHLLV